VEALQAEAEGRGLLPGNIVLATALLNALRTVDAGGDASVAAAVAAKADALVAALRAAGTINVTTYACALALHAERGDAAAVGGLLSAMEADGVPPSPQLRQVLELACAEGGLSDAAPRFRRRLAALERLAPEPTAAAAPAKAQRRLAGGSPAPARLSAGRA